RAGADVSVAHVTADESIAVERAWNHARTRLRHRLAGAIHRADLVRIPLRSGPGARRVLRQRDPDSDRVHNRSADAKAAFGPRLLNRRGRINFASCRFSKSAASGTPFCGSNPPTSKSLTSKRASSAR